MVEINMLYFSFLEPYFYNCCCCCFKTVLCNIPPWFTITGQIFTATLKELTDTRRRTSTYTYLPSRGVGQEIHYAFGEKYSDTYSGKTELISVYVLYIRVCVCVCVLNSIEASHLIPLTGYSVATGYLTGNNIQGLQSFKEKKILWWQYLID